MLDCPNCKNSMMKVVDTRLEYCGKLWRRRLACKKCHNRFTTYEVRDFDLKDDSVGRFYMAVNKIKEQNRITDRSVPLNLIGHQSSRRSIFQTIKSPGGLLIKNKVTILLIRLL